MDCTGSNVRVGRGRNVLFLSPLYFINNDDNIKSNNIARYYCRRRTSVKRNGAEKKNRKNERRVNGPKIRVTERQDLWARSEINSSQKQKAHTSLFLRRTRFIISYIITVLFITVVSITRVYVLLFRREFASFDGLHTTYYVQFRLTYVKT